MERNNIIIIGLIIVVIALLIGMALMMQMPEKQSSKVTIISKNVLNEGDSIKINLTDLNGRPISNQTVNITVTDSNKTASYYSVVTNGKGIGTLKFEKSGGNYSIVCKYGGNENFTGNNTTQKLEIKKKVVVEPVSNSQDTSSKSSDYYGPEVDSSGITRQEAKKYGYTYTSEHGGHYIGSNDKWDEKAGVYHD